MCAPSLLRVDMWFPGQRLGPPQSDWDLPQPIRAGMHITEEAPQTLPLSGLTPRTLSPVRVPSPYARQVARAVAQKC